MTADARRVEAWIGLGSNENDPELQVQRALLALAGLPETQLRCQSALYRTSPMGPADQPDYINAVASVATGLGPEERLVRLQALEVAAGRERCREVKWGPRPLDLDLLTYGAERISQPGLTVPHPGIAERNFVLLPLLSVAPGLEIPGRGSVRKLAAGVAHEGVVKLG
jgi:2-amino-4-hydroxy-6-hydroxymethyldihydropteridine diphosphokinase